MSENSQVWYCIPSKRPAAEVEKMIERWNSVGVCVALQLDTQEEADALSWKAVKFVRPYKGYAEAVNWLTRQILETTPECDWIITGGDDITPVGTPFASSGVKYYGMSIAQECSEHFGGTFGIMQPTGDRWGEEDPIARAQFPDAPAYIDRVCGSPWMGREWCERMYQGQGPLWPGWFHMFVDEELKCVAEKYGALWQRRDLTHFHNHAQRDPAATVPDFLRFAYSPQHWEEAQELFRSRKAADFPGHDPIAAPAPILRIPESVLMELPPEVVSVEQTTATNADYLRGYGAAIDRAICALQEDEVRLRYAGLDYLADPLKEWTARLERMRTPL